LRRLGENKTVRTSHFTHTAAFSILTDADIAIPHITLSHTPPPHPSTVSLDSNPLHTPHFSTHFSTHHHPHTPHSRHTHKMKRNIVIFLIILILFILIALIAWLIYYLQTRMAVGGTASSGSDMTSVA
jgi:hypothetical protein